jgi:hypothetical protein
MSTNPNLKEDAGFPLFPAPPAQGDLLESEVFYLWSISITAFEIFPENRAETPS